MICTGPPLPTWRCNFTFFPGWYRVDAVTASNNGQITVTVHPLAS